MLGGKQSSCSVEVSSKLNLNCTWKMNEAHDKQPMEKCYENDLYLSSVLIFANAVVRHGYFSCLLRGQVEGEVCFMYSACIVGWHCGKNQN
jgi:hypothetical protein